MKRTLRITMLVAILFFGLGTFEVSSLDVSPESLHPRIVSYEYLTTCPRCGDDKMEGYYSLVDGYRQEICKTCMFHTTIEAYSNK